MECFEHIGLKVQRNRDKNSDDEKPIVKDSYAFIAKGLGNIGPADSSWSNTWPFFWGVFVFFFQMTGFVLVMHSKIAKDYNQNDELDNPDQDNMAGGVASHFIPANASCMVIAAQVFAAMGFVIFANESTGEFIQGIDVAGNELGKLRERAKTDGWNFCRWCKELWEIKWTVVSCFLRVVEGGTASIAALLTVMTSSDVIDIILNFTAVNYISGMDEIAFEMAKKRWLLRDSFKKTADLIDGDSQKLELQEVKPDGTKKTITKINGTDPDDNSGTNNVFFTNAQVKQWDDLEPSNVSCCIGFTLLSLLFFFFILYVLIQQQRVDVWSTELLRVEFRDTKYEQYSGCYQATGKRIHRRNIFTAYDGQVSGTSPSFKFCRKERRWVFLENDFDDPCTAPMLNVIAHSSDTLSFDISSAFEIGWVGRHSEPLDVYFINNGDNPKDIGELFCDKKIGDGRCDPDLNNYIYNHDGGDCCAATCSSSKEHQCGITADMFGAGGVGFPDCKDPTMVDISVGIEDFSYKEIGEQTEIEVRSEADSHWKEFRKSIESTLRLVCDEKTVISDTFHNLSTGTFPSYDAKVKEGANCSLLVDTFESAVNITSMAEDKNSFGINVTKTTVNYIPSEIEMLNKVSTLALNGQHLHGSIPTEIGAMKKARFMEKINIGSNNLSGRIPTELGAFRDLKNLVLEHNQLTGPIPELVFMDEEGWESKKVLKVLNLGNNSLTGTIPSVIMISMQLTSLNLQQNSLTGTIPTSIGNLEDLEILDLSGNDLEGAVPIKEIYKLKKLKYLDLIGDGNSKLGAFTLNCTEFVNMNEDVCNKNQKAIDIYNTESPSLSPSPMPSPSPSLSSMPSPSPSLSQMPSAPSFVPYKGSVVEKLHSIGGLGHMSRILESIDGIDEGNWTIFAFTDDAYLQSQEDRDFPKEEGKLKDAEKLIVEFHLVPEIIRTSDLSCDGKVTMENYKISSTMCDSQGVIVGQKGDGNDEVGFPKFNETDIHATNGVIHIIDGVLLDEVAHNWVVPVKGQARKAIRYVAPIP